MIVADTHTFIWWAGARKILSPAARAALESTDRIVISVITGWEIAMLAARGRLDLEQEPLTWLLATLARTGIDVVPLPLEVAMRSTEFSQLRDPADQMIVATALHLGTRLVTKDRRIRDSGLVATIW